MKLNINIIFFYTKFNIDLLNIILNFARPNRTFKSKTAILIKDRLQDTSTTFNPIVFVNNEYVIFWKNRKKMPLGIYLLYRKYLKITPYYERMCN